MKRILSLLTILFILFSMAGCAGNGTGTQDNSVSQNMDSTEPEVKTTENKKVLVAYFSATGTTEKIAKMIAAYTGADLFELTPENEYTAEDLNWSNQNARVSVEHDDPDGRNVELAATKPEKFGEYDTVFIGYPIWWGIAAWPVNNFVKENDFTGKTVIPFCTAASSDIGNSGELLAQMAGTGDWRQGKRFYNQSAENEINSWIDSFNE